MDISIIDIKTFLIKIFTYLKKRPVYNLFLAIFFVFLVSLHLYIFGFLQLLQTQKGSKVIYLGTITEMIPNAMLGNKNANHTSIVTEDGQYISGTEIEICKKVIDYIQKNYPNIIFKWRLSRHPAILEALKNGEIDVALGGYSVTEQRLQEFAAVKTFDPGMGVLVRADDLKFTLQDDKEVSIRELLQITDQQPTNSQNIKLLATTGGLHVGIAEKIKETYLSNSSSVSILGTPPLCLESLIQKTGDFFIIDYPILPVIKEKYPNQFKAFKIKTGDLDCSVPPFGFFMMKDSTSQNSRCKIGDIPLSKLIDAAIDNVLGSQYESKFMSLVKLQKKLSETTDVNEQKTLTTELGIAQAKLEQINQNVQKDVEIITKEGSHSQAKVFVFVTKIFKSLPLYLRPLAITLALTFDSIILGLILGLILVKIQNSALNASKKQSFLYYCKKGTSRFIDSIIIILQSIPLMVQGLLLWVILMPVFKGIGGLFYIALIVMLINTAIDLAGVMINHIKFLDKGQIEGAYALGLQDKQVFKYIIFKSAFLRTLPTVWNQIIINIKNTTVFMVIGLQGLEYKAQQLSTVSFDTRTPYVTISLIYLTLILITKAVIFCLKKKPKI